MKLAGSRGSPALVSQNPVSNASARLFSVIALCALVAAALSGCAARNRASASPPAAAPPPTETSKPSESTAAPLAVPGKPGKSTSELGPSGYMEEGNASWYGGEFNGRRASNGEIYNMNNLTAAHRTLPFGTMVRVTNVNNGKSTVVRITDRGPFVANRIIDLSLAAARQIDSVGPGVVPVRLEILSAVNPTLGFFTVQVGAFRERSNAERLRERLSLLYSPVFVQQIALADGPYYRVRVGKISGEDEARELGKKLQEREGLATHFVVRLDE